jgi:gliding motility-associated-like protein
MKTIIIKIQHKVIVLCCIFLFSRGIVYSQSTLGCTDTFFRKNFKIILPNITSINNFKKFDSDTYLFSGTNYNISPPYISYPVFGRIKSDGKFLFVKKATIVTNNLNSSLSHFTQNNDTIYWTGVTADDNIFLLKTDMNGNFISSNFYSIKNEFASPNLNVKEIKYYGDREIYVLATSPTAGIHSVDNLLLRVSQDGSVLWSKAFHANNNAAVANGKAQKIFKKNGNLFLAGTLSDYSLVPNLGGVFVTKIDPLTGDVLQEKAWRFVNTNEVTTAYYENDKFDIKEVNGEMFFLWSFDIRIQTRPSNYALNRHLKIKLDDSLNVIQLKQFVPLNDTVPDIRVLGVSMNDSGECCVGFTQGINYYFSSFFFNNQIKQERKISFPSNLATPIITNQQQYFFNDGSLISSVRYLGSTNEYELLKIDLNKSNLTSCLGIDTIFTKVESLPFEPTAFSWDSVSNDIVRIEPLAFTTSDINTTEQVVCYEATTCDTLKISGYNNFCLSNPNTVFRLTTNPTCKKNILWDIDTSSIKIIQNVNDTSINVKFLKPFHNYIRAGYVGCDLKDSLFIDVFEPKPNVNLGPDIEFCITKNNMLHAGNSYKNYKWQDGSVNEYYTVTQQGQYFVMVTDSCGNIFSDTINIKPAPVINFNVHYDDTICDYDTATIQLPAYLKNYTWSPQSAANITGNNILQLFPERTTIFNVSGSTDYKCNFSDTILIKVKNCPVSFFVPSAFSPNHDKKNDLFEPLFFGKLEKYEFYIYNRLGEMVFKSLIPKQGWDGTYKGQPQDAGSYVWYCSYKFQNEKIFFKKGIVVLLK